MDYKEIFVPEEEFINQLTQYKTVYVERVRFSTPKFDNYYKNKEKDLIARHYDNNTYSIFEEEN